MEIWYKLMPVFNRHYNKSASLSITETLDEKGHFV